MLIIIGALMLIIVVLILYFLFIMFEIKKINKQMSYIIIKETNAEVVSTSKNVFIKEMIDYVNIILKAAKKEKMKQFNHKKELHQVISSLSHDLRTPLTVAKGYTQILELDKEIDRELVSKIYDGLNSVNQYIDYLTSYVNINEKELDMKITSLNISELLKRELFIYFDNLNDKGIDMKFDIIEDIEIYTDEFFVVRIIQNTIGNILKYAKSYSEVKLYTENNNVVLIVSNDYYGQINNVNDLAMRFVTTDKSRSNQSVGLGLSIINECVKILLGEVVLKTNDDKFIIKIILPQKKSSL